MINNLLSQLEKVRKCGNNKWLARCKAHEDGRPSLMVGDNGEKITLHCFAGCDIDSICGSLGMQTKDLYYLKKPQIEKDRYAYKELQKEYKEVSRVLTFYADIVGTPEFTDENRQKMGKKVQQRADILRKMQYLRNRNT